jgi:hypothetical protein
MTLVWHCVALEVNRPSRHLYEDKKVKLSLCLRVVSFKSRPLYSRGKSRGTHWTGGWVNLRAGLHAVEKRIISTLPGIELRPLSP